MKIKKDILHITQRKEELLTVLNQRRKKEEDSEKVSNYDISHDTEQVIKDLQNSRDDEVRFRRLLLNLRVLSCRDDFLFPHSLINPTFAFFSRELLLSDEDRLLEDFSWCLVNFFCEIEFQEVFGCELISIMGDILCTTKNSNVQSNILWALTNATYHKRTALKFLETVDLVNLSKKCRCSNDNLLLDLWLNLKEFLESIETYIIAPLYISFTEFVNEINFFSTRPLLRRTTFRFIATAMDHISLNDQFEYIVDELERLGLFSSLFKHLSDVNEEEEETVNFILKIFTKALTSENIELTEKLFKENILLFLDILNLLNSPRVSLLTINDVIFLFDTIFREMPSLVLELDLRSFIKTLLQATNNHREISIQVFEVLHSIAPLAENIMREMYSPIVTLLFYIIEQEQSNNIVDSAKLLLESLAEDETTCNHITSKLLDNTAVAKTLSNFSILTKQ